MLLHTLSFYPEKLDRGERIERDKHLPSITPVLTHISVI